MYSLIRTSMVISHNPGPCSSLDAQGLAALHRGHTAAVDFSVLWTRSSCLRVKWVTQDLWKPRSSDSEAPAIPATALSTSLRSCSSHHYPQLLRTKMKCQWHRLGGGRSHSQSGFPLWSLWVLSEFLKSTFMYDLLFFPFKILDFGGGRPSHDLVFQNLWFYPLYLVWL